MCTKSANINTATACDECSSEYTLEDGKCASTSTNRSGLSIGAIAGSLSPRLWWLVVWLDSCVGGSCAGARRDLGSVRYGSVGAGRCLVIA